MSQKPDAVSWKRLWRGPILWFFGVSAMLLASLCATTTTTATSSSIEAISPALLAALWIIGLGSWTVLCTCLLGNDVWRCIVQPALLQPAVAAASQWSLDDVLQFACDPSRLASCVAGCFLLPATLYALPTTPQQRAQVLRAAGVLPNNNNDDDDDDAAAATALLTEPGSWKYLLPAPLQKCCLHSYAVSAATPCAEEDMGDAETTDDEGDDVSSQEQDQESCPYSISPVWKTNKTDDNDNKETAATATAERSAKSTTTQRSASATSQRQPLEPHELIQKIVTDWLRAQLREKQAAAGLLVSPQQWVAVAVTAATVLALQLRHSPMARALLKHSVHASVTAGAGTALVASLAAVVAPYFLGTAVTEPSHSARGEGGGRQSTSMDAKFWVSSILSTLAATATTVPRPLLSSWRKKLQAIPWKGAAAVFVLALFHQQRRRRLERERQGR